MRQRQQLYCATCFLHADFRRHKRFSDPFNASSCCLGLILRQHFASLFAVLFDAVYRYGCRYLARFHTLLNGVICRAECQQLLNRRDRLVHQLCDFRGGQVKRCQVFHHCSLLDRCQRKLVIASHDASDALNVIAGEGNNLDALYWLSRFTAAQVCAMPAVPLDNPHPTLITNNHFQRRNRAAVHQVVK
uniref:hypothetical protein n=1 Tax=Klebsiella michiganensis TaxID=1134687 RepID=UPI003F65D6ED